MYIGAKKKFLNFKLRFFIWAKLKSSSRRSQKSKFDVLRIVLIFLKKSWKSKNVPFLFLWFLITWLEITALNMSHIVENTSNHVMKNQRNQKVHFSTLNIFLKTVGWLLKARISIFRPNSMSSSIWLYKLETKNYQNCKYYIFPN